MDGQYIGPYQVLHLIRRGGNGSLYVAYDRRLKRRVALKYIALGEDAKERQRIIAEAGTLALLNHQSIVQIFDIVELRTHVALILEYVPGTDLEQLSPERELSLVAKLNIAVELCGALAAAHEAGIVYRDLKPSNVLINPEGFIKLSDFGIAAELEIPTDDVVATPRRIPGSLLALSPEQASGQPVDARSDLFSLGLLLYRLFSGRHPLLQQHESQRREWRREYLKRLQSAGHEPLLIRQPELPTALSHLIDSLLEKDPAQRPATALAVREELTGVRAEQGFARADILDTYMPGQAREEDAVAPVLEVPEAATAGAGSHILSSRQWRPFARNPTANWPVFAVGLVLVVVGYGFWSLRFWHPPPTPVKLAVPSITGATNMELPFSERQMYSMLSAVVKAHPLLDESFNTQANSLWLRARCHYAVCGLQVHYLEPQREPRVGYVSVLPEASPEVWRAQIQLALNQVFGPRQ